jgi:subtilase family serine protease
MVWGPGTYGYLVSDLEEYYSKFGVKQSTSLVKTLGYSGVPGGDNFGEATLDVQTITGIGQGILTYVYNTDNSTSTEEGPGFGPALQNFVTNLANQEQVPNVISMSLGSLSWYSCNLMCTKVAEGGKTSYSECIKYVEYDQRQVCMYPNSTVPDRINVEFQKLGVRGVTLLAATGDGGSHFSFEPFDPTNPIGRQLNTICCNYNFPTFPAASPFVLGVGGSEFEVTGQQKAWSGSGGAFSWEYSMPSYQQSAVQNYLKTAQGLPPRSSFNASNRAYPDVSALATNVPVVLQGQSQVFSGTSCSTPEFAGVISLINDARLNSNLPPLGFVNTRLYQINEDHPGEAFVDITDGNTKTSCDTGFPAAAGWDPTTGLGAPLWGGLFKYLSTDN